MKKYTKLVYCLYFIFTLLLIGCSGNRGVENTDQLIISLPENNHQASYLDDFFILESIVPIETNEFCLIETIERVILYKEKAIILNGRKEILIINNETGIYIGHIRNTGNGPGEYIQIMDIAFDEGKENIIIYTDSKRLLLYDINLNYIEEINIENDLFEKFTCLNDMLYFYNPLSVSDKEMISLYDLNERRWDENIGDKNYNFNVRYLGLPLVKSQSIWYTSPLKTTLTNIHKLKAENIYKLDIENFGDPDKMMEFGYDFMGFFNYVNEENLCYVLNSVRETSKSVFCKSNRHSLILIDKATNQANYLEYLQDLSLGFLNLNYFPHDGDDDRIMFILSPEDWMAVSKSNADIPKEINEDSNPILLFYKEK